VTPSSLGVTGESPRPTAYDAGDPRPARQETRRGDFFTTTGEDDEALGLLTSAAARDVFVATMERAVAPGLDRYGLEATLAWRTRSLS
jgi:hypothetical protein